MTHCSHCGWPVGVEATAAGTARQVDRLLAAVEAARDTPLSLQHRADRISAAFVPLVVVAAALTFGYWAFLTPAGWEAALFHAMSVLLVACTRWPRRSRGCRRRMRGSRM